MMVAETKGGTYSNHKVDSIYTVKSKPQKPNLNMCLLRRQAVGG